MGTQLLLTATTTEPSPFVVVGAGTALISVAFAAAAPLPRYAEITRGMQISAVIFAALGGTAAVVAAASELSSGRSLFGSITLLVVVAVIVLILVLPKIAGFYSRRKGNRVHKTPREVATGKPPAPRINRNGDGEVSEHEAGAVQRQGADPQSEPSEG